MGKHFIFISRNPVDIKVLAIRRDGPIVMRHNMTKEERNETHEPIRRTMVTLDGPNGLSIVGVQKTCRIRLRRRGDLL
jgi:hypothetical protein